MKYSVAVASTLVFVTAFVVSGCGQKNSKNWTAYYEAHIEEAKVDMLACADNKITDVHQCSAARLTVQFQVPKAAAPAQGFTGKLRD